jgi:hypothetical protein
MEQDGRTCRTRGKENTMEIQLHGATAPPPPSEEIVRELLMGTTRPAAQRLIRCFRIEETIKDGAAPEETRD